MFHTQANGIRIAPVLLIGGVYKLMFAQTLLTAVRWFARISAAVCVVVLLLFLLGEPFRLSNVTWTQLVALAFFPIGLIAGLILGWSRELTGGLIAVGSVACFYVLLTIVDDGWPGWWFLVFATPGFLFIFYGIARTSDLDTLGKSNGRQEGNIRV
jgi:hypothetical protein